MAGAVLGESSLITSPGLIGLDGPDISVDLEKDFKAIFQEALNPSRPIPPDLKIDDRDIPQAKNLYEFTMNSWGIDQPLFARQLWMFVHLFGEYCPNPKCTNMEMWEDILSFPVDYDVRNIKEDVTFLEHGVCPKCKSTRSDLISGDKDYYIYDYMELALAAGQRSGKSIITSVVTAYLIHRFLKLQNPAKVYELTKNQTLTMTFVAQTFAKAKSLLYNPVLDLINDSEWFQTYGALMRDYEERYSEEGIYIVGKEFMSFRHRKFGVLPASPNKRVLRGDTRILAVIDELGWFQHGEESNDRERASANEVHEALDRSLGTVRQKYDMRIAQGFNDIPNAYGIYASSPSATNDKIMSLVRQFQSSDIGLGINLPTWEINPDMPRNARPIRKAYLENPEKADRDWAAKPPLSDAAFISDTSEMLDLFSNKKNLLRDYKYTSIARGEKTRRAAKFRSSFKRAPNYPTILCMDAGVSANSFGLALGGINSKGKVCVLGFVEIAPAKKKPLDHSAIYKQIILEIIKNFNVVKVIADRWQSIKLLQDVEADMLKEGKTIATSMFSIKRMDFDFVLDYMMDSDTAPIFPQLELGYEEIMNMQTDNYPECFKYKPVSHMLFQMSTVRETYKTIDKGRGYTDDIFRATFLLLAHLYDEDDVKWLLEQKVVNQPRQSGGLISSSLNTSSQNVSTKSSIGSLGGAVSGGTTSSSGRFSGGR